MALKPAIGKKYAKLREEQERLLSNEESKMASATSSQRLELLAAAATANAWQVTRPTFLDESRPELPSQECLQMESILLQAMEMQQKHLVSIRQRLPNAGDGEGEEVNAQTSLEHIQRTLEATQLAMVHWGHRAMLPATAPQVLQYLNTRDTFAFRTVNPAVCRACQDGDLLLMPCLDMVPEHRDDMPLFFTQLSLGSTKVMWMNSVGTLQVLETRFSLPTLETLLLPKGLGILLSDLQVPSLPCLRRLYVRAGIDNESEFNWPKAVHSSKGALPDSLTLPGVQWIRELISKTSQRLCLIDVEELDSRLAQPFLQVVSGPTRPKRLVLRRCVLPDAAIQDLCTFLEEPSRAQFVVHFDNCELSIFSEQLLAQALEQFERFCAFSIDGGKVSEKPIEVSEWCQATPRFVQERSCTAERNAQFVAAEVAAKGIPSPITESDSNEEAEDAVAVTAPPPRQVDHINQLSTAELLAHVLRRLEEDRLNPTSQASAIESFRAQLAGQAASASGAASSGDFLVPMQPESSLMGLGTTKSPPHQLRSFSVRSQQFRIVDRCVRQEKWDAAMRGKDLVPIGHLGGLLRSQNNKVVIGILFAIGKPEVNKSSEWKITDLDPQAPAEASVILTGRAFEHWGNGKEVKVGQIIGLLNPQLSCRSGAMLVTFETQVVKLGTSPSLGFCQAADDGRRCQRPCHQEGSGYCMLHERRSHGDRHLMSQAKARKRRRI